MNRPHHRILRQIAAVTLVLAGFTGGPLGSAPAVAEQNSAPAVDRPVDEGQRGGRGRVERSRAAQASDSPRGPSREGDGGEFRTEVPTHAGDWILARPTPNSITLSMLAHQDCEGYIAYGTAQGQRVKSTPPQAFKAGQPVEILIGSLQPNTRYYYAWQWGDALFVVLDPFWFAPRQRRGGDNWTRTLGAPQYQWLRQTLQQSRAKFKFVFLHHLVGGADQQSRGGAEAALFYEWGGQNADGSEGFQQHRPGWPEPIHPLLVRTGVSVVFHGHDHLFAKQDRDGMVYQEAPQPGLRRYNTPRTAAEYGYVQGLILGGPGHLRIAVSPVRAGVDFVNSCLPEDETAARQNREIRCTYSLEPIRNPGLAPE